AGDRGVRPGRARHARTPARRPRPRTGLSPAQRRPERPLADQPPRQRATRTGAVPARHRSRRLSPKPAGSADPPAHTAARIRKPQHRRTENHTMTSTEPNAEVDITRANALDVDLVLGDEEQVLSSQLKATVDPAERAELFWRAARNQERQAVTW